MSYGITCCCVKPFKVCFFFFYYATEKDKLQNFPAVWQNKTGPNDRKKKNIQTEIWPLDLEGDYLVESDSFAYYIFMCTIKH